MAMIDVPIRRANLSLAMYAAHLGSGNSISCKSIRSGTIKGYIRVIARFLEKFGEHPRDLRKDGPTATKFSEHLESVYKELERWEAMPDRREPFTVEMLQFWEEHVVRNHYSWLSAEAALADWFQCGIYGAFRKSEWAQDAYKSRPEQAKMNGLGDPQAFCIGDVRAVTFSNKRISGYEILKYPVEQIRAMWLRWRTQKNGTINEERLFTANSNRAGRDFIRPMYRILQRFSVVCGMNDYTTPLAAYSAGTYDASTGTHKVRLITSKDIESAMQFAASKVYGITAKKDLSKWSAHSLRVGACVILHSLGFSATQIQFLLRWKSMAFMDYLRNLAVLADRQNEAVDDVQLMPNFL